LDREDFREEQNQKANSFLNYFGIIMAVFYVILGIAFLFFPIIENLSGSMKTGISALLIIYGLFRFYRIIKK